MMMTTTSDEVVDVPWEREEQKWRVCKVVPEESFCRADVQILVLLTLNTFVK